jgi:hypothetical protein
MFIRYKSNYFKKFIHLPYYIIRKNYTSFYVLFDRLKNIKNLSLQSKLSKFIRRPSLDKISLLTDLNYNSSNITRKQLTVNDHCLRLPLVPPIF